PWRRIGSRMAEKSPMAALMQLRGDVRLDFVTSDALEGNALGDPARRPVLVYLPPEYDALGSRRYPVLYVLHGYTGDAAALAASRPWETNVFQWIDRLIEEG